jgi:ribose transport system substrate-binding protein
LKAIFVAFDPGAVAALSVVKQKNLLGKVAVVGFDAIPVALKAIQAGEMNATVRQDPARMGKEGVALAIKAINGEKIEKKTLIPGLLITKENVDQFLAPAPAAKPVKKPSEMTIAFSGFAMTNEFWLTLERAAEAEAKALGVKFINLTTEVQDADAQKRAVDNAITQKVDGIIIGATDSRGWDDTLAKAKAAGIVAIAVDTAIENDYIASLIQTDNLSAAGLAGDYLCKLAAGSGKALVLGGSVGHQTGDARKKGVEDKLKACGVTVIGDYSNWDENKSAELAQNTLTANPDLKAIFVAFDPGAVAALSVVKQKNLLGKVAVVGFDAIPVALKAIQAGEMNATVRQDPARMGKEGVDLIVKVIQGEKVEKKTLIPGLLITKDNVAQFLK